MRPSPRQGMARLEATTARGSRTTTTKRKPRGGAAERSPPQQVLGRLLADTPQPGPARVRTSASNRGEGPGARAPEIGRDGVDVDGQPARAVEGGEPPDLVGQRLALEGEGAPGEQAGGELGEEMGLGRHARRRGSRTPGAAPGWSPNGGCPPPGTRRGPVDPHSGAVDGHDEPAPATSGPGPGSGAHRRPLEAGQECPLGLVHQVGGAGPARSAAAGRRRRRRRPSSAIRRCRPSSKPRPSAPRVVDTTGMRWAAASRIFNRVPLP